MTTNINKYKKALLVASFNQIKGLTSGSRSNVPPDRLSSCNNVLFNTNSEIVSRPPAVIKDVYAPRVDTLGDYMSVIEYKEKLYFNYLNNLYSYNGTSVVEISPADSLTASRNFMTDFLSTIYITQGTSTLATYDGTTLTASAIEMPQASIYGNALSIANVFNSIFVITDKNYLRYTGVGTDDVWEERTLMGGTVAITAGTTYMTGTETIFTQAEVSGSRLFPQAGQKMYITQGAITEYLTISSVRSTTEIFTVENSVETYTDATWYLKGIDFYEPIDVLAGTTVNHIVSFGNYLAISKGDAVGNDLKSSITILKLDPIQNTNILKIQQKHLYVEGLHPYSIINYKESLFFMTSNGIYKLNYKSIFNEDYFEPIKISMGKLDLSGLNLTYRRSTKAVAISNGDMDGILFQYSEDQGSYFSDTAIFCYEYELNNYEFTKLEFPVNEHPAVTGNFKTYGLSTTFGYIYPYKDEAVLLTDNYAFECFNFSDTDYLDHVMIDETEGNATTTAVTQSMQTGMATLSDLYGSKLNKFNIKVTENIRDALASSTYSIQLEDEDSNLLVDYSRTVVTDPRTGDIKLFCNARNQNEVGLNITSDGFVGSLKFYNWSLTLNPSKFG